MFRESPPVYEHENVVLRVDQLVKTGSGRIRAVRVFVVGWSSDQGEEITLVPISVRRFPRGTIKPGAKYSATVNLAADTPDEVKPRRIQLIPFDPRYDKKS